ncbi:MAG: methyltransferase domain-containing protein [Nocardioidaceae bacterium]
MEREHSLRRQAGLAGGTAGSVLDVGCGDGFLAARLSRRVPQVVALDIDRPVLDRARARFPNAPVTWQHGDVLTDVVTPPMFDAVVSNATLHHLLDTRTGLRHLGSLVRPGGTVAIVTFARTEWRDIAWASAAFLIRGLANRLRGKCEHSAPTAWPPATPSDSYAATPDCAAGARVSRLLLGRVLIRWQVPAPRQVKPVPEGGRIVEPALEEGAPRPLMGGPWIDAAGQSGDSHRLVG